MNDLKFGTLGRCFLTWLAATAAAAALVAWAAPDLTARPGVAPFDAWLTWLCAVVAALCAVWGWVVTTAVVLEALATSLGRTASARGVPAWARTLVLGACGVAAIGSAAPALAAEHHQHEPPSVLEGLPLPDRAEGAEHRTVTELVAVTFSEHSERPAGPDRYEVRRGDSLWSIANDQLGDPALWPQLYALNRDVVGPDPDLIRPGQLLRLEDVR